MRPDAAPQTVANFLNYVNRGAYDGSFPHRSVAGFILQGGGFRFVSDAVESVPTDPPVANEFNLSNVRGTPAMAKLGNDPNSAISQWFFNGSDGNAANLDAQNGGFTVFGSVVTNGLTTVDAIAALPTRNAGGAFSKLTLVNYDGGTITGDNLVVVNTVRVVPLVAKAAGDPALLKIVVSGNGNPGLVRTAIVGQNLVLTLRPGRHRLGDHQPEGQGRRRRQGQGVVHRHRAMTAAGAGGVDAAVTAIATGDGGAGGLIRSEVLPASRRRCGRAATGIGVFST